jgi:hypothetical protein
MRRITRTYISIPFSSLLTENLLDAHRDIIYVYSLWLYFKINVKYIFLSI